MNCATNLRGEAMREPMCEHNEPKLEDFRSTHSSQHNEIKKIQ